MHDGRWGGYGYSRDFYDAPSQAELEKRREQRVASVATKCFKKVRNTAKDQAIECIQLDDDSTAVVSVTTIPKLTGSLKDITKTLQEAGLRKGDIKKLIDSFVD